MQQPFTTFEVDGEAICDKRMQAGIEVKDLAAAIGVSDSYIRKLETGARKRMTQAPYGRLCAALHANRKELLAPQRGQATEERT